VFALLVALAALSPSAALAASASFNDVESQLMCDTCNVALPIADSTRADQERAEIHRLIRQGKTKQQILDIFRAEYGDNVLAQPTGGGSAIASWAVPAGLLLLAVIAILVLLPRWRRNRRGPDDDDDPSGAGGAGGDPDGRRELSADDAQRLERDLALYDL
jgi:cytochrome c-type biogenesis protein CcmH